MEVSRCEFKFGSLNFVRSAAEVLDTVAGMKMIVGPMLHIVWWDFLMGINNKLTILGFLLFLIKPK